MFSIRLSSALYPTQLHRRNVCVHMRAHHSIDIIIPTYAASLMVYTRPVRDPLREELRMRLSASHKDSWSHCGEAAQEPGRFSDPSPHTRHRSSSSPPPDKREEFYTQEVSCIANGCIVHYGRTCTRHVCSPSYRNR